MKKQKTLKGYLVVSPDIDPDFFDADDVASTKELAWRRFCHPALLGQAYENDGFYAAEVTITIHPK